MANYTVTLFANSETGDIEVVGATTIDVNPSDSITFKATGGNMSISGFDSAFFTDASNGTVTSSGLTRTLKSSLPSAGSIDDISITKFTFNGVTLTVRVGQPADTTPDAFDIGNKIDQYPRTRLYMGSFVLSGVNRLVSVVCSGDGDIKVAKHSIYNPQYTQLDGIENGTQLYFFMDTPQDFNQSITGTITVSGVAGSYSDNVTIYTKAEPDIENVIYIGVSSGDINLVSDIGQFFGYHDSNNIDITDYVKGGDFVPSISQNSAIPTAPPIDITDFYDAANAFYFILPPGTKTGFADTTDGSKQVILQWDLGQDFILGYGNLSDVVECYYQVTIANQGDGTVVFQSDDSIGAWSVNNDYIRVSATAPQYTEELYRGTITINVRSVAAPQLVLTRTVEWMISFFGP